MGVFVNRGGPVGFRSLGHFHRQKPPTTICTVARIVAVKKMMFIPPGRRHTSIIPFNHHLRSFDVCRSSTI